MNRYKFAFVTIVAVVLFVASACTPTPLQRPHRSVL